MQVKKIEKDRPDSIPALYIKENPLAGDFMGDFRTSPLGDAYLGGGADYIPGVERECNRGERRVLLSESPRTQRSLR